MRAAQSIGAYTSLTGRCAWPKGSEDRDVQINSQRWRPHYGQTARGQKETGSPRSVVCVPQHVFLASLTRNILLYLSNNYADPKSTIGFLRVCDISNNPTTHENLSFWAFHPSKLDLTSKPPINRTPPFTCTFETAYRVHPVLSRTGGPVIAYGVKHNKNTPDR